MTILPSHFRETIGQKKSLGSVSSNKTIFSIPNVTVDVDKVNIQNLIGYAVAVCVDEEGTEFRRKVNQVDEDIAWWEGKPININIYVEFYIEGGETELYQTTRYTEEPDGRLTKTDYQDLVQDGVNSIVKDINS